MNKLCSIVYINGEKYYKEIEEKPMLKVIFESEEEAIQFHHDVILDFGITSKECFLNGIKEKGYIRKSPIDIAEEMYNSYSSCTGTLLQAVTTMNKQHEAIQYLKAENERLKK